MWIRLIYSVFLEKKTLEGMISTIINNGLQFWNIPS